MRWYALCILALLLGAGTARGADPEVTNVQAGQVPRTRQVQITYDVSWAGGDTLDISVVISQDAGTTFDIIPITVSGAIGRIIAGTGKSILWEAGQDVNDGFMEAAFYPHVMAKVIAIGVQSWTFDLLGGATMAFVPIPRGTFLMGAPDTDPDTRPERKPQHEVTITREFYLGKYEVTQEQWEAVMRTTPWSGQSEVVESPQNPAAYITWYDAQAFIHALNMSVQDSLYRLPTEADWEYACRAGTTTEYSFGSGNSNDYSWHSGNTVNVGESYAHQVGTKLPNPWGLYDMHGNMREYCQDKYSATYYSVSPSVDPPGPDTGTQRVTRGGGFIHSIAGHRSEDRDDWSTDVPRSFVGFRVLRFVR